MRKLISVVLIGGLASFAAVSQDDPIETRQGMMKKVGKSMKTLAQMAQGKADYNPDAALIAFQTMNEVAQSYGNYFPPGSDDGDTDASPKIWENKADFESKIADFRNDTAMAIDAAPGDLDSFKPVFGEVAGNCKACHESYKIDS